MYQGLTLRRRLLELWSGCGLPSQPMPQMPGTFVIQSALDDGDGGVVCSLEKQMEASDIDRAETAAIHYCRPGCEQSFRNQR